MTNRMERSEFISEIWFAGMVLVCAGLRAGARAAPEKHRSNTGGDYSPESACR